MAQKVNQQLRETWRKRIDRQSKSGQTVAEFCRKNGISTPSFYYWKRKLQAERPPGTKRVASRRKSVLKRRQAKASATLASTPFVQLPLPAPSACPWIEVVLAEGTIVRLPQQNMAALQTVLGTLGNGVQPPPMREVGYA